MAKKKQKVEETASQRQSRKEILLAQKHAEQIRNIRIGAIIVGVLLAAVILVAVVNEYVLSPRREVATVGAEKITLQEWQERVRFERAQRIFTLEDQLEMFNEDVGLVQQYSGQTINELQSTEGLGEAALNRLAQDKIVYQALEERGIEISEEELERRIGEAYNYFGGKSPTPFPEPTETIAPTPSVTPIGSDGEADVIEEEPPLAVAPTSEPVPTATLVSEEAFQQEYTDLIDRYRDLGVDEEVYRSLVASSVAGERLLDILAEEADLPEEDIHASAFLLYFASQEEAEQALSDIEESDFLTVWNTINSQPPEPLEEGEDTFPASASEILWQTMESIANGLNPEAAAAIFSTPIDQLSDVIEVSGPDGSLVYLLVMPSGHETRPLSENELRGRKVELLSEYVDDAMNSDVDIGEFWRSRVPTLPILNPKFLQPPTPTPDLPENSGSDTTE